MHLPAAVSFLDKKLSLHLVNVNPLSPQQLSVFIKKIDLNKETSKCFVRFMELYLF